MPVPSYAQGIQMSFLSSATAARLKAHADPKNAPPQTAAAANNLTFDDMIDIVNPLQHLPVVGTLYRKWTGDEIRPLPKMIGDTVYGGPMGLASSVADYGFQQLTGKDFGDTVYDFVFGDDTKPALPGAKPATALASKDSTAPASVPAALATNVSDLKISPEPNTAPPASTQIASAAPKPLNADASIPTLDEATFDALIASINQKTNGDSELSQRAVNAYRAMNSAPAPAAPVAP